MIPSSHLTKKCNPTINQPLQPGDRLYTSESGVFRRQILTYKVDPRSERILIFPMAVYEHDEQPRLQTSDPTGTRTTTGPNEPSGPANV